MEFERYKEALKELIDWNKGTDIKDRNEATTRLHLIDKLLFSCLDWDIQNCTPEEVEDSQYTDYTLSNPSRVMIIEAKKEGVYFELPLGLERRTFKISSLFQKDSTIRKAIEQVVGYCQKRGVTIGAVTNGFQFIILVASRNDGQSPLDGKAIVFKSLEDIYDNFLEFWQFMSKTGILEKRIEKELLGISVPILPAKFSTRLVDYPGTKNRNSIQADLQILSDLLLEELITSEELEEDFLKTTYCSSGALSQYALTSKNILLSRYSLLSDKKVDTPAIEPMYTKKGRSDNFSLKEISKRPILLLGDVGAGKTMFIKNFIKIEAPEVIKETISLYVDLGSKAALSADLKMFFLDEIATILLNQYDIDIQERNFIRGVYNIELQRFERGIYSDLRDSAPAEYKKAEIDFLSKLINNKEEHIKYSLHHIARGRSKQIVLFMDNVDQRNENIQEDAFFISQEIAANWDATVFLTLRPQTYYRSKLEGALTGYHPKAFTIAPPRVDEVILKRLKFAQQIAKGEKKISVLSDKVIIKLSKLLTYLEILEYSFSQNQELIEFIDNISYGNIRLALEFITTFISSGHVDTEKIFEKDQEHIDNIDGQRYRIALHEFLRAIIFGDHKYYYPSATCITNVFDISENDPKEHFLICLLIDFLNRASSKSKFGFVDSYEVVRYLQNLSFNQDQIFKSLIFAINQNLIEAEGRTKPKSFTEIPENIRITTLGAYHVQKLISKFVYIDAILVDTPILDENFRGKFNNTDFINDRLNKVTLFTEYLDINWKNIESEKCGFNWPEFSEKLKQDIKTITNKMGF
jgi:hypothetical protein